MRASGSKIQQIASSVRPRTSAIQSTPYSWINNSTPSSSTGTLAGKSIAIKDNISYTPAPTSCSSSILQEYNPPYNATCVESLVSAGAHVVGQTKMDEFGMGSLTTHLPPFYSLVHNPASPSPDEPPRSAGGSSGGSAAAVAEESCWAALGTDTGGSVRLPASYCGVVGLKPSYGMISRRGIIAYADSLDCVGILAKEVDDVEQVFDVISQPDGGDMTCSSSSSRSIASKILQRHFPKNGIRGLRIGLPQEISISCPPSLIKYLKSQGAEIVEVSLPALSKALPAYYVLASAEASSNLGRFGGGWYGSSVEREKANKDESGEERRKRIRTEGFGKEVKKRILAGTWALSADEFNNTYLKALHLRHLLRGNYQSLFRIPHPLSPTRSITVDQGGIDMLLHPTAIRTAPVLKSRQDKGSDEYNQDLLTVPASLAGLPAMSVPSGKGKDGWPIGVSLTSQWGMEGLVFKLGKVVEGWSRGQPTG
ncbi:aspartyl/glutamyl-tRNA(Asn/Gln) amidotransferase, A subunit [Kwoniella shivajii]|uniref:Glutamyl-tRNA(Gln) amidotransferase subunit A, mitochondrial n=1 Tax=Kwoniella shivajii TaxID=564305 RepID=A0ABZ1CTX9_9TREE|nr:aspartyl/glutamyl-tRNA(Asn/Gln) amidotransferase, A subunit [Kwoniella shivajii]